MKFKIPFSFASVDKLKKRSAFFQRFVKQREKSKMHQYLDNSDTGLTRKEYLSICIGGFVSSFLLLFLLSSTIMFLMEVPRGPLYALGFSFAFGFFVFFTRSVYPKVYDSRKQREIERNIISALQDILVQLTSGIPLFSILVNISDSDYGALSDEFRKMVRKINAGLPELEVFQEAAEKNYSQFFRRALWQISNGMRAGSDISIVVKDTIQSLNEEQLIQIQNYGNKLNPSIMFYMLVSVIMPALAVTFLTIISSLINLGERVTMIMFVSLFVGVLFVQVMFLGVIRSIRPSLMQ